MTTSNGHHGKCFGVTIKTPAGFASAFAATPDTAGHALVHRAVDFFVSDNNRDPVDSTRWPPGGRPDAVHDDGVDATKWPSPSRHSAIASSKEASVASPEGTVPDPPATTGTVSSPLSWAQAQGVQESEVDDLLAEHWHPQIPMGRLGQVDEIAATAVYLASDESAWTTGSILTVDGGQTSA